MKQYCRRHRIFPDNRYLLLCADLRSDYSPPRTTSTNGLWHVDQPQDRRWQREESPPTYFSMNLRYSLCFAVAVTSAYAQSLHLPAVITEGSPSTTHTATITVHSPVALDTVFNLESGDTNRLWVPPTATVLAGQTNAAFHFLVLDNRTAGDSTEVAIAARSPTGGAVTNYLRITDDDPSRIRFGPLPIFLETNAPVSLSLTAENEDGSVQTNFNARVTISAYGTAGSVSLQPDSVQFARGIAYLQAAILEQGRAISIRTSGYEGVSETFNVVPQVFVSCSVTIADIAWHERSETLFATLAGSNSIVAVDLANGEVTNTYEIGSEPGQLEIAPSGDHMYVAIEGGRALRRFDLKTRTAGETILLGTNTESFYLAADFCIPRGMEDALIVSMSEQNGLGSRWPVGIYRCEGGVKSPLPDLTSLGQFHVEPLSTEAQVLTSGPLTRANARTGAVLAVATNSAAFQAVGRGGEIFDDQGNVYAVDTLEVRGCYPGVHEEVWNPAAVELLPEIRRVAYLAGRMVCGYTEYKLKLFDRDLFQPLLETAIPPSTGVPTRLIRCGTGTLAYVAGGGLWLIRSDLVQPPYPAADIGVSVGDLSREAVAGEDFLFTISVTNAGPGLASMVRITNSLPENASLYRALSSAGQVTTYASAFTWEVSSLQPGATATLNVTLRFGTAGLQTNHLWALGYEIDPVYTNNRASFLLPVRLPDCGEGVFPVLIGNRDIAYDPVRDRVLLSIANSGSGSASNCLAVMNPHTGVVEAAFPLSDAPGLLAVSDDARWVYVSIPAAGKILRMQLPSFETDMEFSLGGESIYDVWYPWYAADMSVVPGAPGSLVVWRVRYPGPMASEYGQGLALYTNGIPALLTTEPGGNWRLQFDPATRRLFAWDAGHLWETELDYAGLTLAREIHSGWEGGEDFRAVAGHLFTTGGLMFAGTNLQWRFSGAENAVAVEADAASKRVFYLVQKDGSAISAYDYEQFRGVGSLQVPTATGTLTRLIRWGTNGLAFRSSSNQVFIIRSPLAQRDGSADLKVQYTNLSAPQDSEILVQLSLTNLGPLTAEAVSVTNILPAGVTLLEHTASAGAVTNTGGTLIWSLPSVTSGGREDLLLKVQATFAARLFAQAGSATYDSVDWNNASVLFTGSSVMETLDVPLILPLPVEDLAWLPRLNRLLVQQRGTNGFSGGTVATLDLSRLELQTRMAVGTQARELALALDQSTACAGADYGVVGFELPSFNPTYRFLVDRSWPRRTASDIQIALGNPDLVFVASREGPIIAAYDRGAQRPLLGGGLSLATGGDPHTLYASGGGLRRYSVEDDGLVLVYSDSTLLPPTSAAEIAWGVGRIFASTGRVIDPAARKLVGTISGIPNGSRVLYDEASSRAFYICPGTNQAVLVSVDASTLLTVGRRVLPGVHNSIARFARWGVDGFAVTTTNGQTVLFRSSLVATNPPADVAVSLTQNAGPINAGSQVTANVTITNRGPNRATDVAWTNALPPGTAILQAIASTGSVSVVNSTVSGSIPALPPNGVSTVQISFTLPTAGIVTNQVSALSSSIDPNFGDNSATSLLWVLPTNGPTGMTMLNLPVKDLERDPTRPVLYASFGAGAGQLADSVIAIEPLAGRLGTPVRVGSDPGKMAASADGRFLYVALDGAGEVRKLALPSLERVDSFAIPQNDKVTRLSVSPVSSDLLVMRRSPSGKTSGLTGGQPLPGELLEQDLFSFTADGRLFACDGYHSNVKLYEVETGAQGLTLLTGQPGKQSQSADLKASGNLLFYDRGMIVDPGAGLVRSLLPVPSNSVVEPDSSSGRAFFVTGSKNQFVLRAYDIEQGIEVAAFPLPGFSDKPRAFLRWGIDGLALCNTNSQLLILRGVLVPTNLPAQISITQWTGALQAKTNETVQVTLQVTNSGPGSVSSLVVTQTFSMPVSNVKGDSEAGSWTSTNAMLVWRVGELAATSNLVLSTSFRPVANGTLNIRSVATHEVNDPFWGDNTALNAIDVSPDVTNFIVLNLATRDLVYDAEAQLLYASIPASNRIGGNIVCALDPTTGETKSMVPAGSEPGRLAISAAGRSLYVAQDGSMGLQRIDLEQGTAGEWFPFGADDMFYALGLAARPGHSNVVAAALGSYNWGYPYPSDVYVYNNGVRQVLKGGPADRLVFSESGDCLFGTSSGLAIRMLPVEQGLITENLFGFTIVPSQITPQGGRIYADTGEVLDASTGSLLGSFEAAGPHVVDTASGVVFYLSGQGGAAELRAYDIENFALKGSEVFGGVQGTAGTLVKCGTNRFAFRTTGGQLFLVRSELVPTNSIELVDLTAEQVAVQRLEGNADEMEFLVTIRNRGKGLARGVALAIQPPAGAVALSLAAGTAPGTNFVPGTAVNLGLLPSGGTAEVTLRAIITNTLVFTNLVSVTSACPEANLADNVSLATITGIYFPPPGGVRKLDFGARALACDPVRHLLYAAEPGSNVLVCFDVASGLFQGSVPLSISPTMLVVDRSGDYLYAASSDSGLVQRVDLNSRSLDLSFRAGDATVVASMAVLASDSRSLVVCAYGANGASTAIFDDGHPRPRQVAMPFSLLAASDQGTTVYGYSYTSTGGDSPDVFEMGVSELGLQLLSNGPSDTPAYMNTAMVWHGNRLYFPSGDVMRASDWLLEKPFDVPLWRSGMVLLPELDRATFLVTDYDTSALVHLRIYALETRELLLDKPLSARGPHGQLAWCGADLFAFIAAEGIVFVRAEAIPAAGTARAPTLWLRGGNPLQLDIAGQAGKWYSVETSPDLRSWSAVTNFFSLSATNCVSPPAAVDGRARFYRVVAR